MPNLVRERNGLWTYIHMFSVQVWIGMETQKARQYIISALQNGSSSWYRWSLENVSKKNNVLVAGTITCVSQYFGIYPVISILKNATYVSQPFF